MTTIQNLRKQSTLPALETRMLLQHVTKLSRVGLISHEHDDISSAQLEAFQVLSARRIAGEPMAYIIGKREFYGRDFIVTPDVLIPRPDTETLIDTILETYKALSQHPLRLLDLGTGSGIIAITLAIEYPAWQVFASDISPAALDIATQNAQLLDADVAFYHSHWLDVFKNSNQRFDLIVSNPPYIEANDIHLKQGDVRFEPKIALTDEQDGLTNYRYLVDTVPDYLNNNGQLWFEHGYNQAEAVRELMRQKGYLDIRTVTDLGAQERVTGGRYFLG